MLLKTQILFIIFFAFLKAGKKYNQITFDNREDFNAYINKHFKDFGNDFGDDFFRNSGLHFNNNL